MFYKELDTIKAAEDQAEELIKKAGHDAKELLAEKKKLAEKLLEEGKKESLEIFKRFEREGTIIAESNYDDAIKEAKRDALDIERSAYKNKAGAVDIISERIVRNSVNS